MEGALVTDLDSSWASCTQGLHKKDEEIIQITLVHNINQQVSMPFKQTSYIYLRLYYCQILQQS